ncbi:hypothetical protein HRbin15_00226 [bacterium HR15]|nr:hypothetical protein HRbin15_00226 [bacterium HR15]
MTACLRWISGMAITMGMLHAQPPYNTLPDWRSDDRHYATGGVFADIDRDGLLDFVVSNGNDMARERVAVYYNRNGILETTPSWQSSDIGYHGHLAVGDMNGDGWLDVAVTLLRPQGGPGVKVYLNQQGTLSSSPSWTAAISFPSWWCAWGDVDSDGDLDLAVGATWPYGSQPQTRHYIFYNQGGTLERTPRWQLDGVPEVAHMEFCDVDDDGDLDLVLAARSGNAVYLNTGGVISTTPHWVSTDNNQQFANTLALGDVSGDGRPDLIVSDNNQLTGGSGFHKLYRQVNGGIYESTPSWQFFDGYASAVALADIDSDGRLDLAVGKWWGTVRLFLNQGTGFANTPSWTSGVSLVVEAICFGDLNRDGVQQATFRSSAPRKLFYLGRQPVQRILRVVVDGQELAPNQFCYNLRYGWVSLAIAPMNEVQIEYEYSTRMEMGVTDWERRGNIVFYHRQPGDVDNNGCVDDADLLRVLFAFGLIGAYPEDLTLDGTVDDEDLLIVLFNFGSGC